MNNAQKTRGKEVYPLVFYIIGFGCQKVDFNLVAGKLHKAETVFVTLGEN